jgi:hypothetical protein
LFLGRGDLTTTEIFRNIKGSSALMETLRKILRKKCGWTFEVQDVPGKKIKRYKLVTKEV